ncbi:retrovirus-related pol polyprotein from transposon TNT 1-94 [Tanacetum coccineum]
MGVNILKSIDEGPFKMGKFRETLAEGAKGALHLGPERDRVFADLTPKKRREQDDAGKYNQHAIDPLALVSNVLPHQYSSQSSIIPQSAYVPPGRQNRSQGNHARGAVAAGNGGVQNRVSNANPGQARQIKCYKCNEIGNIARNCTQLKRLQNSEYFKDKMLLMQAQENRAVLDEKQLLFIAGGQTNTFDDDVDEAPVQDLALNEDNVFQADQCDAFDSDVDEAPTAQTMFMANLLSADPIYDKAGPSYDSDILSEGYKDIRNKSNFMKKSKDLAIKKSMIWYTLKKRCVELVREILTPRQHTFAQELKLENHPEQHIRGVPRSNSMSYFL